MPPEIETHDVTAPVRLHESVSARDRDRGNYRQRAETSREFARGLNKKCSYINYLRPVAEREGFEPSIRFPVYTLSKRAP